MKNLVWTLVLFTVVFLSCNKNDSSGSFKIGIEEEFRQGQINAGNDNSLQFSITEINDSRCPSDVICVWEGKADVKIEIESPQKGNLILSTYNNQIDTLGIYTFELIDVSPYPVSTETIELKDYNVTLLIEEIEN